MTEFDLLVTFPASLPGAELLAKLLVISPSALRVLRVEGPLVGLDTSPRGSASEYLLD